mgnify:CR=1 FL=1
MLDGSFGNAHVWWGCAGLYIFVLSIESIWWTVNGNQATCAVWFLLLAAMGYYFVLMPEGKSAGGRRVKGVRIVLSELNPTEDASMISVFAIFFLQKESAALCA